MTPTDERILLLLHRVHYATVQQIQRRYYAPTSGSKVRGRLKSLFDMRYVNRLVLPRRERSGSSPHVYFLGRRGRDLLRDMGHDIGRQRPSEEHKRSLLFLDHTLAVVDVLIACELAADTSPDLSLRTYVHEREMRRVSRGVIPDAWVDLGHRGYRYPLLLEVDQGTIDRARIQEKVRGLMRFYEREYEKLFQTRSVQFCFLTTSDSRRDAMVDWIGGVAQSDAFLVTSAPRDERLFTDCVWIATKSGKNVTLYD